MQRMPSLKKEIRGWLLVFIICLVLGGITAFAIETELRWLLSWWPDRQLKIYEWLQKIYNAVKATNDGCIACILIFPLAFIAGELRHIPVFWRFIDCSFGIIGIVPLWICYKKARLLEKESATGSQCREEGSQR